MRTITTPDFQVMSYDELSSEAKKKAIENMRSKNYQHNDFSQWIIDDCYLLNPNHKEVVKIDKTLQDSLLIKNNRKIYFSLDRDRFIDISNAMEIVSDEVFLEWLGITERLRNLLCYSIGKDTIQFEENNYSFEFTKRDLKILDRAINKFENHCSEILDSMEKSYDYYFSDDGIVEEIYANEMEFTEDGKIFI